MNRSNCGESRMNWLRPLGPCSMAGRGKSRMPRSRNSLQHSIVSIINCAKELNKTEENFRHRCGAQYSAS